MTRTVFSKFSLFVGAILWLGSLLFGLEAAEKAKIVFIHGKPSHGPMAHEHRAGSILLAKALSETDLQVDPVVLPAAGYPVDASVLADAATIVVFCTGHQGHLLNPKLDEFDALMKKGTGVVMIHWATEAQMGRPGKKFLEWMGGFCALDWSVNPHWTPQFAVFPDHPVANGLTPFGINDEWYYHMRFVSDLEGVTPILSAVPGPDTLKRPDGPRSGNAHVRAAVARGESQHVAWAFQRPDGKGRGFGFTGAHNHLSWQNDNFRKVVLNAILWTAHVDVPNKGVPSKRPTDEEMRANLDDKGKKPAPKKQANRTIQDLEAVRRQQVRKMDTRASLDLLVAALDNSKSASTHVALLKGILLGLEGERDVAPPRRWIGVSVKLSESSDEEVRRLTGQLGQVFGDEAATQQALTTLARTGAELAERRQALASLLTQQRPELLPLLGRLLDEEALRIPAIRGYSVFESKEAPKILLSRYADFSPEAQRAVIETLAMRASYAQALHRALKAKKLRREDLPAYVARSLSNLLGEEFTREFGVKPLSEDKEALIAQYKKLATPEALAEADVSAGRLVYQRACMVCHKLYGEGGLVGPELTGSNRADLNYLLLNMLDPNSDIPDAYRMVLIVTKDGQVRSGSVTEEDDQRVVLSMAEQRSVVAKSDIESRQTLDISMMPEGILQSLTDKEVLDLIKYFQTKEQVDLPR